MNPNLAGLAKLAASRSAAHSTASSESASYSVDRTPCVIPLTADDEDMPQIGSVIGRYTLTAKLGSGASSVVYKAMHRKLELPVAVKVLKKSALRSSPSLLQQLTSEAVLLARVNHPHVVRLWDLDDEGEHPYLVMEFIEGQTLEAALSHSGRLPLDLSFALIRQAVEGLAAAHATGIIHRDVKPSNLLIDQSRVVKVADLGQASLVEQALTRVAATPSVSRGLLGAVAYLAPEQALNPEHVDFRADMYSLGVTLYQAITGRLPFEAKSAMQMIMKHVHEEPIPAHQLVDGMSNLMAAVVTRLIAKRPDDRYSSYEELRVALALAVGDRRAPRALAESFLSFLPPAR